MSTTRDITNTAVFERPKFQIRSYCQEHIDFRSGVDSLNYRPSVRALRSEVHRDNAETQRTALLWRRRPR